MHGKGDGEGGADVRTFPSTAARGRVVRVEPGPAREIVADEDVSHRAVTHREARVKRRRKGRAARRWTIERRR